MTDWGPFLSYWGNYCKDVLQSAFVGSDTRIRFSEGLLRTLYYETDVGSIPRGIKMDCKGAVPKFGSTENWSKQIQGCYWCQNVSSVLEGICCQRDCLYFLHEFCIERAVHFTRDRYCRLPGCDKVTYNYNIYCGEEHRAKFDSVFPKWTDSKSTSLTSIVRAGPTWYKQDSSKNTTASIKATTQPQPTHSYNLRNTSAKSSTQSNSTEVKFGTNFPLEFRNILIHKTDIGVIPRRYPTGEDLTSKYFQCPNWLAVIKGCYYCGRPEVKDPMNDHFCRLRCYLLFYEWCRRKVESMTKISFCQYPECPRKASDGFQCCNREHTNKINELYSGNKIMNIEQVISVSPKWYVKSNTPHELVPHSQSQQMAQPTNNYPPQQLPIQYNPTINFILCPEMTLYLFQSTDIGPVPRGIEVHFPPLQRDPPSPNWYAPINMCYWCCIRPPMTYPLACSNKCLFLFVEWLHTKVEAFTMNKFCKNIGCTAFRSYGFQCCNREHSTFYESTCKEYFPLLRHTEFALGPVWYNDYTRNRIEFYNREDPFYEFTNFFPCDNLFVNGVQWKTTEHYFQAMKFYGTPYFYYVATLQSARDAFSFSRKPQATKWIRPNWHSVKQTVMLNVLRAKFSNNCFAQILLRTGDAILIEHTKNDTFWGDGGDGSGENKLGILLMHVRNELRSTNINPTFQQNPTPTLYIPIQHFNSVTQQEVNKKIKPTAKIQENTNSKPKIETIKPVKPELSQKDNNTITKQSENKTGFIANLVPSKSNNDSNTNNIFDSKFNPFSPSNLALISGEAKYQLPDDYECPFVIPQTDNMETELENENESSTLSRKLARIESENNQTKHIISPNQISILNPQGKNPFVTSDDVQEMDTSRDSDDLIDFSDNNILMKTSTGTCNGSTLANENKNQDTSTANINPFQRESSEDKSPKSKENYSSQVLEQSPCSSKSIHPSLSQVVPSAASHTNNANPFKREKISDNEPHNSNENSHTPVSTNQPVVPSAPDSTDMDVGESPSELLETTTTHPSPNINQSSPNADGNPFKPKENSPLNSNINSDAAESDDKYRDCIDFDTNPISNQISNQISFGNVDNSENKSVSPPDSVSEKKLEKC